MFLTNHILGGALPVTYMGATLRDRLNSLSDRHWGYSQILLWWVSQATFILWWPLWSYRPLHKVPPLEREELSQRHMVYQWIAYFFVSGGPIITIIDLFCCCMNNLNNYFIKWQMVPEILYNQNMVHYILLGNSVLLLLVLRCDYMDIPKRVILFWKLIPICVGCYTYLNVAVKTYCMYHILRISCFTIGVTCGPYIWSYLVDTFQLWSFWFLWLHVLSGVGLALFG